MSAHSEEKKEEFQNQQAIMAKIMAAGFENYAQALPDLKDAFDLAKHGPRQGFENCLCCMDERTPFGLHSAGSGMLLPDEEFDRYFDEAGIRSISSHDGCGAGRIYCQRMGLDVQDSDKIAREWAEGKAKERSVPHVHLSVDKPFHYARVCYYDGTGRFNYKNVEGLPSGLVVGRRYMSEKASLGEASIAAEIIFGGHGFGKDFLTEQNPFYFVAIGKTKEETDKLKVELAKIESPFEDRIRIDGFMLPTQ